MSQHRQTWKLREYHSHTSTGKITPVLPSMITFTPLELDMRKALNHNSQGVNLGSPLRAFFSAGTCVEEAGTRGYIEFRREGHAEVCRYLRAGQEKGREGEVGDVVVAGEVSEKTWGGTGGLGG